MKKPLRILILASLTMLGGGLILGCASKALKAKRTDSIEWNVLTGDMKCTTDRDGDIINVPCRPGDIMIQEQDLIVLIDKIFSQCN